MDPTITAITNQEQIIRYENGNTDSASTSRASDNPRTSFLSLPLSAMQSLKPLDRDTLQTHIREQLQQRRRKTKEMIANMYTLVRNLERTMEEFISTQDDLILRACGHELETIGSMEYEQELLREQMMRFIKATSSSFTEIFHQSPTPP